MDFSASDIFFIGSVVIFIILVIGAGRRIKKVDKRLDVLSEWLDTKEAELKKRRPRSLGD